MTRLLPSRRNRNRSPHTITLRLNDIHDLFAEPRLNPFLEDYLPVPGIDQIALQLRYARLNDGVHVTLVLPTNGTPSTDLRAEVQAALKRYCDLRLANLDTEIKARGLRVVRSLQIGIIILGISLALAAAISSGEFFAPWLRTLLSNSISIFGTVALWSPTDAFLFGMRPMYNDVRIYKAIQHMTFDIQYTGTPIPAATTNP